MKKGVDKPQPLCYTINTVKERKEKRKMTEEKVKVIIRDTTTHDDFHVLITKEKRRFLDWLLSNDLISDGVLVEDYEDYEFKEV